jgi:tetratricopeptide (TPR) repeat protein
MDAVMRNTVLAGLIASAVLASDTAAQEHAGHTHDHGDHTAALGSVAFENSANPAAQTSFLRGVALLHSFEYQDAADAFRDAQRSDPSFALAYWMEALTTEHPLWGQSDVPKARSILAGLGTNVDARLARAATERERRYGAAIEALFAAETERERITAFADSMRRMPLLFPDDLEAAAFASIAALAASYFARDAERTALLDEAIERAEFVFARNQNHPGAAHYLIHAYDNPQRAARGLPFARAYARIAPAAEHALHMPSHIFVQIGMWHDAVSSNEQAWAASRAWVARRGLSGKHLDFHSLQWLQYGYLQQGRYREALAIIDTARTVLAGSERDSTGGPDPLTVLTRLAFQYGAETGDWNAVQLGAPARVLAHGNSPRHQFFARIDDYQQAAAALLRGVPSSAAPATAGSGVLELQLRALRARAAGDEAGWIAALTQAAEAENLLDPTGPPTALVSHELLGAALLTAGDAESATARYEESLTRRPRRPAAMLGLARARLRAGDETGAADAYRELLNVWARADSDIPALAEARARSR